MARPLMVIVLGIALAFLFACVSRGHQGGCRVEMLEMSVAASNIIIKMQEVGGQIDIEAVRVLREKRSELAERGCFRLEKYVKNEVEMSELESKLNDVAEVYGQTFVRMCLIDPSPIDSEFQRSREFVVYWPKQ